MSDIETDRSEVMASSDGDGVCEKRKNRLDRGDDGVMVSSFLRDTETLVNKRAPGSGLEYHHMKKIQLTGYVLENEATATGGNEDISLIRDSLTLPHLQLPSSSSLASPTQGKSVEKRIMLCENNPHCMVWHGTR